MRGLGLLLVAVVGLGPAPALAAAPAERAKSLASAIRDGSLDFRLRYRLERVDQDGFERDATASTARARLTWTSRDLDGLVLGFEADASLIVGIEDFNSTDNGRSEYPIVADPEGVELNQAFLKRQRGATAVTLGRQRINHGRQRFLGGVAFRNNEQTYDALRIERDFRIADADLCIDYSYIHNVNRVFGPGDDFQPSDWRGATHALRIVPGPRRGHAVEAFAYGLDFDNDNGPANSSATVGLTYRGSFDRLAIEAAVARQSDHAGSAASYRAGYYYLQGALELQAATLAVGIETLGSDDGAAAFRTPLGTLHKFQGWTDRFLQTPAAGVRDVWASARVPFPRGSATVVYHDFNADHGGADYGSEVGVALNYPLHEKLALTLKVARYEAEAHATDTAKGWLMLNWQP